MVDKLTLLFLSAELEMDDDDGEMNLEESVVTAYCSHSCCFHVSFIFREFQKNVTLTK
jgi:hypothetical protein